MRWYLFLLLIVISLSMTQAQDSSPLPEEYSEAILSALSKYPELENVSIKFVLDDIGTTMSARPNFNFLIKSRKNRKYIIKINDEVSTYSGILLSDLPFFAQVGVIGHELAHIVEYKRMNNFQIITMGIAYSKYKLIFEHNADMIAINHGFGPGLVNFTKTIVHGKGTPEDYLENKLENYFNYSELEEMSDFIGNGNKTSQANA